MKLRKIPTIVGVTAALSVISNAAVIIEALDLRSTGVFGHDANAVAGTINASGDPVDFTLTYNNLNIDGDGSANDSVTFTVSYTSSNTQRLMNQGADTGFGNLNDLTVSVTNVTGSTTDSGSLIQFDGFTGATAAAGRTGDIDSSVEVNGNLATFLSPDSGAFQFLQQSFDFAASPTVLFDNSVNNDGGTIVARNFDLQFSAIPEPSVALLGALGMLGLVRRRR